jgi:hypothetical protein
VNNWREAILREFVPQVNKLTLVADPDSLLTEEKLSIELRSRGFDLIEFDDPIAFRYAYESKYRSIWDGGGHTDLVVILRLKNSELDSLPFDLLNSGRRLLFSLGEIFPNMSYPVIECLDRMHLDALFDAQSRYSPDRMGDNATKDFILRHVFGIAAELIVNEVDLLRGLIRLHYNRTMIPDLLCTRLVSVLALNPVFVKWPLETIVSDAEKFFGFLQERWPVYLKSLGVHYSEVREHEIQLTMPGPELIPFGHQDIRIYIDNLFLEGRLSPVTSDGVDVNADPWIRSGVKLDSVDDRKIRTKRLFAALRESIPKEDCRHNDWLIFATKWAELLSMHYAEGTALEAKLISDFRSELNRVFDHWMEKNYSGLINLPPSIPAMVHHIPRMMARELETSPQRKVALIVVDGLSLDQWCTVKSILAEQDSSLEMKESATFAWVPTLTSITRQSIFAGKPPLYFPTSISSTEREPTLWKQFWEAAGISKQAIGYQKNLGEGDVVSSLDLQNTARVFGLVISKVDKIMHGMQLGAAGMHNQVGQWCRTGYLTTLLNELLDSGFDIWLTADHGNLECKGIGRLSEGAIAETRGERVRIYPSTDLRDDALQKVPSARNWNPVGLPSDMYPLMAENAAAFITEGETIVAHGGSALEEVIVPLVRFHRRVA